MNDTAARSGLRSPAGFAGSAAAHAAAPAFMFLDALPLTKDLKVDRRRLPEPARQRPSLPNPCVAARTELERHLARAWSEVLEMDQVGVTDSFFDLGGDSLRAARIVAHLTGMYGEHIRIANLFEHPTIAALAGILEGTPPRADTGTTGAQRPPRSGHRTGEIRAKV